MCSKKSLFQRICLLLVSAMVLAITLGFAGYDTENIYVSNLVDEKTLQEVSTMLIEASFDKERVQNWGTHVQQFAKTPGMENLIHGYQKLSIDKKTYDEYDIQDAWAKAHPDLSDINCRINAWELVGNFITISDISDPDERSIVFDKLSLEDDSSAIPSGEEEKFKAFYTTVNGENSTDSEQHKKLVLAELARRGVSYDLPDGVSLVELYVHGAYSDEDNELFVGHIGVLIEDKEKNELLWVEKIGFQAPYRAVKLQNRQQLYDYLMKNYGAHSDDLEAAPFVLENGTDMKLSVN